MPVKVRNLLQKKVMKYRENLDSPEIKTFNTQYHVWICALLRKNVKIQCLLEKIVQGFCCPLLLDVRNCIEN